MESHYGPARFCESDIFAKASPISVSGPATRGEHAIDPRGTIARLTNPRTYSTEARLNRNNPRKTWRYEDYIEQTEIFKAVESELDFIELVNDKRGIKDGEWMLNLVVDDEIVNLRTRIDDLDVSILTTMESNMLGDSRVELADRFDLHENFLSKRFWVFPQGNIQVGRARYKTGFSLTVRTLEGGVFIITSDDIVKDLAKFLDDIRNLIPNADRHKEIWWNPYNPETSKETPMYALPGTNFLGPEFLPYLQTLTDEENRTIWVGTAGGRHIYPIRPVRGVVAAPNTHWWVTFVDSVTGEAYIHDSVRGMGTKSTIQLVENANWIIENLPPAVKERLSAIRKSQRFPFQPISVPVQSRKAKQQGNSSDCGPFVLGNIMGFVDRLRRDDVNVDGICKLNLIPKGWAALDVREEILARVVPVR